VKSRASGTTPLAPSKLSLRICPSPGGADADDAGADDAGAGDADADDAGAGDAGAGDAGAAADAAASPSGTPEAPLGSGPRSPGE
jgi:streptogrisin D